LHRVARLAGRDGEPRQGKAGEGGTSDEQAGIAPGEVLHILDDIAHAAVTQTARHVRHAAGNGVEHLALHALALVRRSAAQPVGDALALIGDQVLAFFGPQGRFVAQHRAGGGGNLAGTRGGGGKGVAARLLQRAANGFRHLARGLFQVDIHFSLLTAIGGKWTAPADRAGTVLVPGQRAIRATGSRAIGTGARFRQITAVQQFVAPAGTGFVRSAFRHHNRTCIQRRLQMLGWALTFLVIALIAAALGFGGIAGASAGIAQILFVVFLILFVIAMIARAVSGRPPV